MKFKGDEDVVVAVVAVSVATVAVVAVVAVVRGVDAAGRRGLPLVSWWNSEEEVGGKREGRSWPGGSEGGGGRKAKLGGIWGEGKVKGKRVRKRKSSKAEV